jgi:hypothetical protein
MNRNALVIYFWAAAPLVALAGLAAVAVAVGARAMRG